VEYGEKGEKKHMTFADAMYGPRFEHLAPLLAQRRYTPHIICESRGTMAEDARTMRDIYEAAVLNESAGKQETPTLSAE
jgi:deoxyribonuclease-4